MEKDFRIMKKLLLLIPSLLILSYFSQAQTMRIDLYSVWIYDTVQYNQQVNANIAITNTGSIDITDSVGIVIAKDTAGLQVVDTVYYNLSGPLVPGDSVALNPNWLILPQKYTPGNNITVIWPIKDNFDNDNFLELNSFVNEIQSTPENDITVSVFPNPGKNYLYVESSQANFRLQVIDLTGKIIQESREHKIPIHHLPSGLYFIRLYFEDGATSCIRFQKL